MVIEPFCETVLVDGIQLTSAIDRKREAELLAGAIPPGSKGAWVYGPALGDTVRELLKRQELERLHVAIMSTALSAAVPDDRAWMDDPRVTVHRPGTVTQVTVPMVVSQTELKYVDEGAVSLRDQLMAFMNQPFNDFIQKTLGRYKADNERENADCLATDPMFGTLRFADVRHSAVIAAGPTLSDYYDRIKRFKGTGPIIAASTALIPMLKAGIAPDYVMVLDSLPAICKHFPMEQGETGKTTLVYVRTAHPAITHHWAGPRVSVRECDLFPGGSVLHGMVSMAISMGSPRVNLFGADLCFPGNVSHVEGATRADMAGRNRFRTVDGYGREVFTEEALSQYRTTLEMQIGMHPTVRFIKWGKAGVAVKGAKWGVE